MPVDYTQPVYIYDPSVDADLDSELRMLFTTCWPGPMFRDKRYNAELPGHRWIIRGEDKSLVAHLAVHDKLVAIDGKMVRIGGVAEVCVHPEHRGKKFVSRLLTAAHGWMEVEGISFSLLFGRTEVYASQGYRQVPNLCRYYLQGRGVWETGPAPGLLACPIDNSIWPQSGLLDLRCPSF